MAAFDDLFDNLFDEVLFENMTFYPSALLENICIFVCSLVPRPRGLGMKLISVQPAAFLK